MQEAWRDVPAEYELVSQRKGFKRYKSPRLVELLREHGAAQEQREAALSGVLQVSVLPCATRAVGRRVWRPHGHQALPLTVAAAGTAQGYTAAGRASTWSGALRAGSFSCMVFCPVTGKASTSTAQLLACHASTCTGAPELQLPLVAMRTESC